MLQIDSAILLEEFRAIKLPKNERAFVDNARRSLQQNGDLMLAIKKELRLLARRYVRQLKALRIAREKAKKTVSLKKLGISSSEAARRVKARQQEEKENKNDFGF